MNVIIVGPNLQNIRVRLNAWYALQLPPNWQVITPTTDDVYARIRSFAQGDAKWTRIEHTPISEGALSELTARYGPPVSLEDIVREWKKTPWRKR